MFAKYNSIEKPPIQYHAYTAPCIGRISMLILTLVIILLLWSQDYQRNIIESLSILASCLYSLGTESTDVFSQLMCSVNFATGWPKHFKCLFVPNNGWSIDIICNSTLVLSLLLLVTSFFLCSCFSFLLFSFSIFIPSNTIINSV